MRYRGYLLLAYGGAVSISWRGETVDHQPDVAAAKAAVDEWLAAK